MYLKRVKRKCSIRGCKNTDCFAVSRTREVGNTVIICEECLKLTLDEVKNISPNTKSNVPKTIESAVPPLFFNAEISVSAGGSEPDTAGTSAEDSSRESTGAFICEACGKTFENDKGLRAHKRFCTGGEKNEAVKHV